MAKRRNTRPCDPYTEEELEALGQHVTDVVDATGDAPAAIRAEIEFHGTIATTNGGVRTFTLDQLTDEQRRRVVRAADAAQGALELAAEARPKSTYNRKGWLPRFVQLSATAKGRAALRSAGIAPRATQLRWLSGIQAAGPANQRAIARAYEEVRMEHVHAAQADADDAILEVAETFDQVVAEAYGTNGVRFRGIES